MLLRNSKLILVDNFQYKIVVYDYDSEHSNQLESKNSFAFILLEKLAKKFKSTSFLNGGFLNFKLNYPEQIESTNHSQNSSNNLDEQPYGQMNLSLPTTPHYVKDSLCQKFLIDNKDDNVDKILYQCHDKKTEKLKTPTKILDFLYLGSQEDALSESTMKVINIFDLT